MRVISSPVSASITTKSILRLAQSYLVEGVRIKLLIYQNGSRIDGGSDEFKPDLLASSLSHRVFRLLFKRPHK
jgi:hypothetical protein